MPSGSAVDEPPPAGAVFSDDEDQTPEEFREEPTRRRLTMPEHILFACADEKRPVVPKKHLAVLAAFFGPVGVIGMESPGEFELIVDDGAACLRWGDVGFPLKTYDTGAGSGQVTMAKLRSGLVRVDSGSVLAAMIEVAAELEDVPYAFVATLPCHLTEVDEPSVEVYGRAYGGNGVCCVSSLAPLRAVLATACHEALHAFGVEHCVSYRCLMNSAPGDGVADEDACFWLCSLDRKKLAIACGVENLPSNRDKRIRAAFRAAGISQ